MQDFMGKDGFSWFVGVVEDRNDPAHLGRVRVRVLGRHTEDLTKVKTSDLPWAHVMHPVTDPSMQGLGHTPSFLTQGSWVVGFFRDTESQQPVIMGSLPGIPASESNPASGFNDPRGTGAVENLYKGNPKYGPYPGEIPHSGHDIGEPDTNRLARGISSEDHQSLINRRALRYYGDPADADDDEGVAGGIPLATKPNLGTVSDESVAEEREYWEEPEPKGIAPDADPYISGVYPYNHVFESESGHITEVDDSPGAERLFRQHMSGTFEEIHADGSVVTKIMGNNFEIVVNSENIVIKGNRNITVEGSVRELIKGDYIQEIEGDFFQKIHKNHRVKVGAANKDHKRGPGGNREEEIVGNHAFNINDAVNGRIGGDVVITSEKSKWEIIGGQFTMAVEGKEMESNPTAAGIFISSSSDYMLSVMDNLSMSTIGRSKRKTKSGITPALFVQTGKLSIKSGDTLNIKSVSNMSINSEASIVETATTFISPTAGTVYTIKSGGGSPTATNKVDINPE